MKLHEYQGKELFRAAGLPVPNGEVATTPDEVAAIAARAGPRGGQGAGACRGAAARPAASRWPSTPEEARAVAGRILGMDIKGLTVHKVLVEPALNIATEYYAGIVNDRAQQALRADAQRDGRRGHRGGGAHQSRGDRAPAHRPRLRAARLRRCARRCATRASTPRMRASWAGCSRGSTRCWCATTACWPRSTRW